MRRTQISCAGALVLSSGLLVASIPAPDLDELVGDLPVGKAIIFTHSVTVNGGATTTAITSQGTVSANEFADIKTDDPDVGGSADPTVTGVQQRPSVTAINKAVTEDVAMSFAAANFQAGFSDPNAGDTLQVLRITSLPSKGKLMNGVTEITSTPVDIPGANIGNLSYDPNLNLNGPDSFGWNASDGTVFANSPALVNISIAAVNDPPAAGTDPVDRFETQSVKIPVSILLANDNDVEGNTPLSVTAVNYTGGNGASVSLTGGMVFYNPNGHTAADTFEYTVQDSLGASSTGTVNVGILDDTSQTLNITKMEIQGNGDMLLTAAGIPGRAYRVQAADTGIPNWFDLATVIAGPSGEITYTDPGPLPVARIYRIVHP